MQNHRKYLRYDFLVHGKAFAYGLVTKLTMGSKLNANPALT